MTKDKQDTEIPVTDVLTRSVLTAAVVGPILTLINQWEAVTGTAGFSIMAFGLTMAVPFCVATSVGLMSRSNFMKVLAAYKDELKQKSQQLEELQCQIDRGQASPKEPEVAPAAQAAVQQHNHNPALSEPALDNIGKAHDIVAQIRDNARNVNSSSVERVQFISALIERGESVSKQIKSIGDGADMTGKSVSQINDNVDRIAQSVNHLTAAIDDAFGPVTEMNRFAAQFNDQFSDLGESSKRLKDLAKHIRLLAINASIEATRAGNSGLGFMVVAEEVKTLSERSEVDVDNIEKIVSEASRTLTNLLQSISSVDVGLNVNRDKSENCRELVTGVATEVGSLSHSILEVGESASVQLPQVLELVSDIEQIKANTEAAVVGSANNIHLCDQTLDALNMKNEISRVA